MYIMTDKTLEDYNTLVLSELEAINNHKIREVLSVEKFDYRNDLNFETQIIIKADGGTIFIETYKFSVIMKEISVSSVYLNSNELKILQGVKI